ncbi:methyl-accepting chemotaxis protein [Aquabacterium sp.]|uniref:methyl-accepting chemotaxis protein n=1 Tax=Aquabacterium sp. TaxID=1872578 RepID=UPI002C585D87|nr:methyl-accepting chemotaxis protein [Aquabacterium sp.]HSW06793.1 methyl-accepting chemotaxis protein [Aquabacterium sp.]
MRWLIDIPIGRKLLLITVLASAVALLLAGSALVAYDVYAYRVQKAQEIAVQSDILAASVSAALEFNDAKVAQESLNALRANPDFAAAGVYDAKRALLASYTRQGTIMPVPAMAADIGRHFENNDLVAFWPVRQGTRQLGSVYLRMSTEPMALRLARYGGIILLVMLGSLLITLPVAMRLHSVIVKPITEIAAAARRVAVGEIVVPASGQRRADEIGQLQDDFAQMGASLQDKAALARQIAAGNLAVQVVPHSERDVLGNAFAAMLDNLQQKAHVAQLIATGDLTVRVTPQSPEDELGKAFGTMVDNLREMNREVSDGVGVLASSTSAILAGTTQVAAGAAEAAAVISETAVTLNEVKQTALVSSQKAKIVAEAAQRATLVSQAGQRSVDESIEGMQEIREQMETIADSILRLSEQSQAIGELIASVNDLSEQSNLLAVNASIEAARAGEHGKAFAVVALEVKGLAAQSRQATAQVRTILIDIQKATGNAVLATEQGSKVVDAGAKQSQEAGEAIRRLAESIAESASAASQIAVSAQQQVAGMEQLAMAMDNIKTATAQNIDSTRQAEVAAHKLHELGQKLMRLVGRYKV